MVQLNATGLITRIDALLAMRPDDVAGLYERFTGTLTIAVLLHGANSPQVRQLDAVLNEKIRTPVAKTDAVDLCVGMLRSMRAEIESGLIGDLRVAVAGEVLSDLLGLAQEALSRSGDDAINVGAVLVAAAFEDTIRQMGQRFAGVSERLKLSQVVEKLKEAGVLRGADLRIANISLTYRNDALHADWGKITLASTNSLLIFVQGLLSKHFL